MHDITGRFNAVLWFIARLLIIGAQVLTRIPLLGDKRWASGKRLTDEPNNDSQ